MYEVDDYLLYAISAVREMSWKAYKNVFDSLYIKYGQGDSRGAEGARQVRWRSLGVLERLGHIDSVFDSGKGTVYVAPPVLARLPVSGLPQAVLCGARSPETKGAVQAACRSHGCRMSSESHPRAAGWFTPSRVTLEAETEQALSDVAKSLRIALGAVPTAWALLEYSETVEEYLLSCAPLDGAELDWPRLDFDGTMLRFRPPVPAPPAVRLSKYRHPTRQLSVYYLWRNGSHQIVARDWGCYAMLKERQQDVLVYDGRRFALAVPVGAPLPRLLGRSCTLCSGWAPEFVSEPEDLRPIGGYDVFAGVPPAIAETVAAKLGQKLIARSVETVLEEPLQ